MRKVPLAKAVLPPRLSCGARSSTRTLAPCSRAESAAHMPAPPPPTTITSYMNSFFHWMLCFRQSQHRFDHRRRIGDALAGDVVAGAVRDRSEQNRRADGQRRGGVLGKQLRCDV